MKIGLDFDNTLACYKKVFGKVARDLELVPQHWTGGKPEMRAELHARPNGEEYWRRLQGKVYGKYMHQAEMFPEAANFLLRLKSRGYQVFIVSHKTEFGHHDEEYVPLRQKALEWMDRQRFFHLSGFAIPRENVFFANTRAEKVSIISELQCDAFIDDLWEVFDESGFPENSTKILFGPSVANNSMLHTTVDFYSPSWREISRYLLEEETKEDIKNWVQVLVGQKVTSLEQVAGRANSKVFRVEYKGETFAVKWYPDLSKDPRERCLAEINACRFLESCGFDHVLRFDNAVPHLNLASYKWIWGEPILQVLDKDISQAGKFIEQLYKARKNRFAEQLPEAAEACLSFQDVLDQIDEKRARFSKSARQFPDLARFLRDNFDPLRLVCENKIEEIFPRSQWLKELSEDARTLSPSDFGFHNAIRSDDGSITWLDFEYFGWDDPAKLIADFILHPGHRLTLTQRQMWTNTCLSVFSDQEGIEERLGIYLPFFGLRWCLILLNLFMGDSKSHKHKEQLEKAEAMLLTVRELIEKSGVGQGGNELSRIN